jgi:hypothetical protein
MVHYLAIAAGFWLIEPPSISPILEEEVFSRASLKTYVMLEGSQVVVLPNSKILLTHFSPDTGAAGRHLGMFSESSLLRGGVS